MLWAASKGHATSSRTNVCVHPHARCVQPRIRGGLTRHEVSRHYAEIRVFARLFCRGDRVNGSQGNKLQDRQKVTTNPCANFGSAHREWKLRRRASPFGRAACFCAGPGVPVVDLVRSIDTLATVVAPARALCFLRKKKSSRRNDL